MTKRSRLKALRGRVFVFLALPTAAGARRAAPLRSPTPRQRANA